MIALSATIASLLKNSSSDVYHNIYILNDGISDDNKAKLAELKTIKDFGIKYIGMDAADFQNCPLTVSHITMSTYYRFQLASCLPELDKLLYLDCDMIVCADLAELWHMDISQHYAAGVQDVLVRSGKHLQLADCINAGMMLINLAKWREDGIEKQLFDFMAENKSRLELQDQDVLNCVLAGKILMLDDKWNYQYVYTRGFSTVAKPEYYHTPLAEPVIIHYIGSEKPWLAGDVLYREIWWQYNALTAWAAEMPPPAKRKIGLLKSIFSISSEGAYKVITVLGVRVRMKRKLEKANA